MNTIPCSRPRPPTPRRCPSPKQEGGGRVAHIWRAVPQIRCDRQRDRVESSPAQLAAVASLAESLSASSGRRTRVVGWYHSHPHITVLPSAVDLRTQARARAAP